MSDVIESVEERSTTGKRTYKVGTLEYTTAGLVMVFFWLLWGDFCFTVMESVFPTITPIMMKKLGSSNLLIGFVVITLPSMFNFVITPWVSFKSDRHRSKWGRRIPFLLFPTPFVSLFLILIGYSVEIGPWLHRVLLADFGLSQTTVTLGLLAIFVAGYKYFDMFAGSVYYYLFNDVVPHEYLGQFMALFRVVGTAASSVFSFWIFPLVDNYSKEIFLGAGLFYLVAFSLMCLRVKEGEYPPPPENIDGKQGMLSSMKTYFVECFTHRYYWYNFLGTTFWAMSGCVGAFSILFQQSLGLTNQQIGFIGGISSVAGMIILYPAGILSDKKHPLRTILIAMGGLVLLGPLNLVFLVGEFTPHTAYLIVFGISMLLLPLGMLYRAANAPLTMRIYPLERYGQYCAAEAMVRALGMIAGGVLAGAFMDIMKRLTGDGDYYYRYTPLWSLVFQAISFGFMLVVFKYWKDYGGDKGYRPPSVGHVALSERSTETS